MSDSLPLDDLKNNKNTNSIDVYTKNERIVEAVLFLENKPINLKKIMSISGLKKEDVLDSIEKINRRLSRHKSALTIVKNKEGDFHLTVNVELYDILKDHYDARKKIKLSQQAIETLAIIAYKQPVTKVEIESIRGVQVGYILRQLLDYGLIKIVGRKNVPGKPMLYGTTDKFLKFFGLLSLKDLPPIEEFENL